MRRRRRPSRSFAPAAVAAAATFTVLFVVARSIPRASGVPPAAVIASAAPTAPGAAEGVAESGARAPAEDAAVELGRRLFFDPAGSSRHGMRSCADCHDPRHGWSDASATSDDDAGPTTRHSQTLVDSKDNPSAHWDG